MSENCDVIVIFPILGQFGAIQKRIPDAKSVKLTFSSTATFILQKLKIELKSLTQFSH